MRIVRVGSEGWVVASVVVTWNRSFMPTIRNHLDLRIGMIVRSLRDICRNYVSTPYPPASAPGSPAHRRSGAYRRAIFAGKISQMDWFYGVREVDPRPTGRNRGWLGLWLELGTGSHRQPFPTNTTSIMPRGNIPMWFSGSTAEDTATTGTRTSMAARPVLLPTLAMHGPSVAISYLSF